MGDIIRVTSPDKKRFVEMAEAFEVRFGPTFYECSVDGVRLPGGIFSWVCLWSPDSRYVAMERYYRRAELGQVSAALVLYDAELEVYYDRARVRNGRIGVLRWDGSTLVFNRSGQEGVYVESQIDADTIQSWRPLAEMAGESAGE
jgi:hypothetical protein